MTPTDGSVLTSDKFDLAALFRERGMSVPESKRRVRELVDFVRAEDAARPESEPAEAPKPEPAQPNDSKTPTLDAHVALMQRARSGERPPTSSARHSSVRRTPATPWWPSWAL